MRELATYINTRSEPVHIELHHVPGSQPEVWDVPGGGLFQAPAGYPEFFGRHGCRKATDEDLLDRVDDALAEADADAERRRVDEEAMQAAKLEAEALAARDAAMAEALATGPSVVQSDDNAPEPPKARGSRKGR